LGLKGNQFDIALSVFFVSYIVVDVPSNLAFKSFKPHRCVEFEPPDDILQLKKSLNMTILVPDGSHSSWVLGQSLPVSQARLLWLWNSDRTFSAVSIGVVQDFGGLVATRFLLGVAEGQKCRRYKLNPSV